MIGKKRKSPLANRIGSTFGGRKPKRKKALIGIALLLVLPYFGSALAASVTINGTSGSGGIEFGQGSQVTVVCDSTIKTSIDEDWYASGSPSPYFRVKTISLTGINNASALSATDNNQGCGGKALTLKLYATNTIVDIGTTAGQNSATFTIPVANAGAGTPSITGATGLTATSNGGASESSIVLTISNSLNINAADITRVVLESSN
jgi:hypothetical protein